MSAVQTFWLEPTDQMEIGLRRYTHKTGDTFDCAGGYHSALVITGQVTGTYEERDGRRYLTASVPTGQHDDPRWPSECSCGYLFTPDDVWQDWERHLYRRSDTGELVSLNDAPPGACWDADWMPQNWRDRSPDGIYLMVRLPNRHDWAVDSEASNCTRKGEKHHCWVRHGDPRECRVTVDKNGDTCAAGAGSILSGDWHGFLRDGQLVL